MARQWLRALRLDLPGARIELTGQEDPSASSGLRVRFQIKDSTTQTPRIAEIRITNLSEATAQRIPSKNAKVELLAGYQGSYGRIFMGEIKQRRIGRENPTDTYVDIFAATGDRAYNNSVVSKTLPAGSTGQDIYKACLEAMKPFGVTQGQIPDALAKMKYPRPVTLFGMARDHLRTLAQSAGSTWNIRDDKLDLIPKDGALEGAAIVLNSQTGLVGLPTQTDLGIVARCLINTRIGINSTIQINQKSIQEAVQNFGYRTEQQNSELNFPRIAADGLYRVIAIDHVGDTHGQPWYCELYCIAKNGGVIPQAQVSLGRGGDTPYIGPN